MRLKNHLITGAAVPRSARSRSPAARRTARLRERRSQHRLAHRREAGRRGHSRDADQQPVHHHRLGHVARLRPDDLRTARDRQPGRQERDDPVAGLEGRVERRLHAADGHAARRRQVERRQAVHRRRHRVHVQPDQEHPRSRPRRPQADRRQEGRRQRRPELQRVEVRQAGRRAADHIVPEHQWKSVADPSKDPVKDASAPGPSRSRASRRRASCSRRAPTTGAARFRSAS